MFKHSFTTEPTPTPLGRECKLKKIILLLLLCGSAFAQTNIRAGNVTATGNISVGGTLGVTGAASFGQTESAGYIISAKDLASTVVSTLRISHHATLSGAFGLEIHNYNSCGLDCGGIAPTAGVGATNAFVIHQYSQIVGGTAVQFDNTGPSTILTLKNAVNSVTSFGTIGTGDFIDFLGFSSGSPATPVELGHLGNSLQFGTDDSTTTWTFGDGVAANSATSGPRSAISVSSANTTHPAVSISNSATNIYAEAIASLNFGDNITCSTDSGECLHVEKDGTGAGSAEKIINKGTGSSLLVTDGTNTKLDINSSGRAATYNGIATAGSGLVSEISVVDLTAQTAAITTTNLNTGTLAAGQYRVTWNAKVTTAAATSSTLGAMTLGWTDPDSTSLAITATAVVASGGTATSTAGNTTTTLLIGVPTLLNVKASTNITYAFAYASNLANTMAYNLHITLEKM